MKNSKLTLDFDKKSLVIPDDQMKSLPIVERPVEIVLSDVFEHLRHRLDIKHIKTVTYRPQVNLTDRVNRTLVQMIACFVEENHDNWDRFLHEFSFALRTAVNETTGKTLAELFLGRKILTSFRKLINVTDGAEYVGGNIEKLFSEARQNMQKNIRRGENIIEKGERLTSKSMIWY
ncbi:retrovirus-related Pol polyprotein from transposon 297 [Trichonephila clavipes]|nr:retrovirus-related Pol polyprotein from transposon 297 [Trichonephila clavipes]